MSREFTKELNYDQVSKCRDALTSCPADKFDLELCKELTEFLDNPAKHNSFAFPRIHNWLKKAFKLWRTKNS